MTRTREANWLSVDDIARRLNYSPRYVRDLMMQGRIRGAKRIGGHRRGVWLAPEPLAVDLRDRRRSELDDGDAGK